MPRTNNTVRQQGEERVQALRSEFFDDILPYLSSHQHCVNSRDLMLKRFQRKVRDAVAEYVDFLDIYDSLTWLRRAKLSHCDYLISKWSLRHNTILSPQSRKKVKSVLYSRRKQENKAHRLYVRSRRDRDRRTPAQDVDVTSESGSSSD